MTDIIKSEIIELPKEFQSLTVEIYNEDNSYNTAYTISDYLSIPGGSKLKLIVR